MTDDLVTRFERDGFVHVRSVFTEAEASAHARAVDQAVLQRTGCDPQTLEGAQQPFVACLWLWEDCPEVRPLTFHPAVGALAARLVGAPTVRLWHDQSLYKQKGGVETAPHQDKAVIPLSGKIVTAWIPLQDVTEENGCMGYFPGSQALRTEYDEFGRPRDGSLQQWLASAGPVFVPARKGDVIFHCAGTLHMAAPNRTDAPRRAYTMTFFADGATRASAAPHPALDRAKIGLGEKADSAVTPIAWPLSGGRQPDPAPWTNRSPAEHAAKERGILPR